jgi:voltage-gated potassium channel
MLKKAKYRFKILQDKKLLNYHKHIHSKKVTFRNSIIVGITVLALHSISMHYIEGLSWSDSIWLTSTTATTVGFGDLAPQTLYGRLITIFLLYGIGIYIITRVASVYFEYRKEKLNKIRKGEWHLLLENHIAFLNVPKENYTSYFEQIAVQIEHSNSKIEYSKLAIITDNIGDEGSDDNFMNSRLHKHNFIHINTSIHSNSLIKRASLDKAKMIIIMATENSKQCDSITFDTIDRLRSSGIKAIIIAEVVKNHNRERIMRIGANSTIRPIRVYPELMARAITSPGAEQVMEEFFDSEGDELIRIKVSASEYWKDLVSVFIQQDIGLLVSYIDDEGDARTGIHPDTKVTADSFLVVTRENNFKTNKELQKLVDNGIKNRK